MRRQRNIHLGGEQLLLIKPPSRWQRVAELPDLRRVGVIALDRETNDPGIREGWGPGWTRRKGHIAGVSVAWREGEQVRAAYLPTQHPDSENFTAEQVARWERDHQRAGVRFVMQNAGYDIGYGAACWDLPVPEKIDDTSALAYMIDEQRVSYGLDALCHWRGIPGKDERVLRDAAAAYHVDPKGEMYKMPAEFVGDYAEQDARATFLLYESLNREIDEQDLRAAYQLEMDLVPVVHEMMRRGIRLDMDVAEQLYRKFKAESQQALQHLSDHLSHTVGLEDLRQTKKLEQWFDHCRIAYPRTPTGAGSFRALWMKDNFTKQEEIDGRKVTVWKHWLPQYIVQAKSRDDAAEKFIRGYLLGYEHEGRLHASVHQYRKPSDSDEESEYGGGTRTYRFSYSDPPLQQMPHRDAELSEIRRCFLPEEGELFAKADYSQQEYRLMVHYAALRGLPKAEEAAQLYRDDPRTDFHSMVASMTGLDRKPAKDANFAKAYGAGVKKFAMMTKKTEAEAEAVMRQYDEKMPFVKMLYDECMERANIRGHVRLLDGARIRFDWWEAQLPWSARQTGPSDCRREEAERRVADPTHPWYGRPLRRSRIHKALNSLIQGGAARQTKIAMRDCARAGLIPLLQVHDELCFSVPSEADAARISEIMCGAVPLSLPMQVDVDVGESWAG